MLSYIRRKNRVSSKIKKNNRGNRPIINVYKSNKNIYVQLIGDEGKIICSYSSLKLEQDKKIKGMEKADKVGKEFAKLCVKQGIKEVVFNKGAYKYIGQVKSIAEACRKEGLNF